MSTCREVQLERRVSVGLRPQMRAREEHPEFKAGACHFCPAAHHEELLEKGSVSQVNSEHCTEGQNEGR